MHDHRIERATDVDRLTGIWIEDGAPLLIFDPQTRELLHRTHLPIQTVYGSDLNRSGLRLITCTNFDASLGHYLGNTIVYAHLTATDTPDPPRPPVALRSPSDDASARGAFPTTGTGLL